MPELPEVETVRRGLQQHLAGRRVTAVEVGRERVVRRTSREALIHGLTDTTILHADRRGKYLLLPLDSGDSVMIHLRMSGQVLLADGGAARPPHTHVVMHFDNGSKARASTIRSGFIVRHAPTNGTGSTRVPTGWLAAEGSSPAMSSPQRAGMRRRSLSRSCSARTGTQRE